MWHLEKVEKWQKCIPRKKRHQSAKKMKKNEKKCKKKWKKMKKNETFRKSNEKTTQKLLKNYSNFVFFGVFLKK